MSLPSTGAGLPAYYVLAVSEASSNLSRYDGVRYGVRAQGADELRAMYDGSRGTGLGAEVKRRILMGTYALSAGYYDAYYKRAQQVGGSASGHSSCIWRGAGGEVMVEQGSVRHGAGQRGCPCHRPASVICCQGRPRQCPVCHLGSLLLPVRCQPDHHARGGGGRLSAGVSTL